MTILCTTELGYELDFGKCVSVVFVVQNNVFDTDKGFFWEEE